MLDGNHKYNNYYYFIYDGNSKIGVHDEDQSLLFDLFKAFYYIENSHKSDFFSL